MKSPKWNHQNASLVLSYQVKLLEFEWYYGNAFPRSHFFNWLTYIIPVSGKHLVAEVIFQMTLLVWCEQWDKLLKLKANFRAIK